MDLQSAARLLRYRQRFELRLNQEERQMTKVRLLLGIGALLVGGGVGSGALAAGQGATVCSAGSIAAGTYKSLIVTGTCTFDDGAAITINGNLSVKRGAVLNDHAASTATVHIT